MTDPKKLQKQMREKRQRAEEQKRKAIWGWNTKTNEIMKIESQEQLEKYLKEISYRLK